MSVAAMRLMFKALGLLFRVELIVVTPCMGSVINTTETDCDYFTHYKVRLENGDVTCRRCTKCDHSKGEGTIFECQNYTDTICAPCKDGETYSLEYDEATVCDECKSCEEGQEVLENCTRFNDIKCGKCLPGYRYDDVTGDCIKVDIVQVKSKISVATHLMPVPVKALETPSTTEFTIAIPTSPDAKNQESLVNIHVLIGMSTGIGLGMFIVVLVIFLRRYRCKYLSHKRNASTEEGIRMISQKQHIITHHYNNDMCDVLATEDTGQNDRNPGEPILDENATGASEPCQPVNIAFQCDTKSECENYNVLQDT